MIIGAVVVYLVLTVPNDLQAAAVMRTARKQIAAGDNDQARASLGQIVQQYPRTDAAAAATVALASLQENEQRQLQAEITALRRISEAQRKQIDGLSRQIEDLSRRIEEIANRPPPAPIIKVVPARRRPPARLHRR